MFGHEGVATENGFQSTLRCSSGRNPSREGRDAHAEILGYISRRHTVGQALFGRLDLAVGHLALLAADATRWRAGIDGVGQALEMHASFVRLFDQVDQVLHAAAESIQFPQDERVTFT